MFFIDYGDHIKEKQIHKQTFQSTIIDTSANN